MINVDRSGKLFEGSEPITENYGSSSSSSVSLPLVLSDVCLRDRADFAVYSVVFMLPAAALFINSARASHVFLVVIFAVSAWNGATFYVEVFGRKYVSPPLYLLMLFKHD